MRMDILTNKHTQHDSSGAQVFRRYLRLRREGDLWCRADRDQEACEKRRVFEVLAQIQDGRFHMRARFVVFFKINY